MFAGLEKISTFAYKKDMTSTFATQFISGSPKADVRTQGSEDLV